MTGLPKKKNPLNDKHNRLVVSLKWGFNQFSGFDATTYEIS